MSGAKPSQDDRGKTPPHDMKNAAFAQRARFALAGLAAAWRNESSFRIQTVCSVLLLIALLALRPPLLWCALCLLMATLVMAAELLNTAIEHFMDHLHPGLHPAVKTAKDCAAAAVLVLSVCALAVGVMTALVSFGLLH